MKSSANPNSGRPGRSGTIGGGLWTALERIVSQVAQLVIFIVAARLLGPADFGLFALVAACAILLQRVAEGGWAPYIMSWPGDTTVPRQVLLVAIASGVLAAIFGIVSGGVLAAVGMSPEVVTLVELFSVWVCLAVVSSTQKGILIWRGQLRASSLAEMSGELVGLGIALLALYSGAGVFALAYGRLAMQATHLLVSFAATRMTPLPGLRGDAFRTMLRTSGHFFFARMIYNFRVYTATFLVGFFLGPAAVGFYRAAERLTGALGEVVGVPAHIVAWNLFRQARAKHDGKTDGFQSVANWFIPAVFAASIPLFLWLGLMGHDIVVGLLGEEWLPALPVLGLLAIARMLAVFGQTTEPVLSLAGEIRRLPPVALLYLGVTVALVAVSAPFGLVPLAVSQILISVTVITTTAILFRRYAAIDWREVVPNMVPLIVPLMLGAGCLVLLRDGPVGREWHPMARAVLFSVPAVAIYAGGLAVTAPKLRRSVMCRLRRRGSKGGDM